MSLIALDWSRLLNLRLTEDNLSILVRYDLLRNLIFVQDVRLLCSIGKATEVFWLLKKSIADTVNDGFIAI